MGLFSSKDNTISDKEYRKLQERARKAEKDWLSKKAADKRKANSEQLRKSIWS